MRIKNRAARFSEQHFRTGGIPLAGAAEADVTIYHTFRHQAAFQTAGAEHDEFTREIRR